MQALSKRRRDMIVLIVTAFLVMCGGPLWAASPVKEAGRHGPGQPPEPALHGTLVLKSMPLSAIVGRKITTWVYLPPGYSEGTARYPVIYLLHGQPGGWTDCYRSGHVEEMADRLIVAGQLTPVILVAFDADGPGGANDLTNFCNRADGYRAEDFIVDELVPYMDRTYRTMADAPHRALWGYSAGGFGALNLGFKHPDIWNVLCCHAGFYTPEDDAPAMNKILGPPGPAWTANNVLQNVHNLPGSPPHVYMDASPSDPEYASFEALRKTLVARDADCETHSLPKAHSWRSITTRCRDSLLFAGKWLAASGNSPG